MEYSICHWCSVISGCGMCACWQADVSLAPSITAFPGLELDKVASRVYMCVCVGVCLGAWTRVIGLDCSKKFHTILANRNMFAYFCPETCPRCHFVFAFEKRVLVLQSYNKLPWVWRFLGKYKIWNMVSTPVVRLYSHQRMKSLYPELPISGLEKPLIFCHYFFWNKFCRINKFFWYIVTVLWICILLAVMKASIYRKCSLFFLGLWTWTPTKTKGCDVRHVGID
jgi:hypothetical protein